MSAHTSAVQNGGHPLHLLGWSAIRAAVLKPAVLEAVLKPAVYEPAVLEPAVYEPAELGLPALRPAAPGLSA
ncbi:hypothetical protein [Catenulispora yoronensis]